MPRDDASEDASASSVWEETAEVPRDAPRRRPTHQPTDPSKHASSTASTQDAAVRPPLVLRGQSAWSGGSAAFEAARSVAARARAASEGRLICDLRPAGAVVRAPQIFDACAAGALDIAHVASADLDARHPAARWFDLTASAFDQADAFLSWMRRGGGAALHRALLREALGLPVVGLFGLAASAEEETARVIELVVNADVFDALDVSQRQWLSRALEDADGSAAGFDASPTPSATGDTDELEAAIIASQRAWRARDPERMG